MAATPERVAALKAAYDANELTVQIESERLIFPSRADLAAAINAAVGDLTLPTAGISVAGRWFGRAHPFWS